MSPRPLRPTRRQLLAGSASALPLLGAIPARRPRRRDPIEELAAALIDTPRDRVLPLVAGRAKDGLGWRDLLAAVFHAGLIEVRPRPIGFKLHCVMVVESLYQLGEAGDERDGWLAALWNLDDFKNSQARDEREGPWRMSAAQEVGAVNPQAAVQELDAALTAGDEERADRAATAAARVLDHGQLFEVLGSHCIRSFTNLGHGPIFTTHVGRVLARNGGARSESALRALAYGLTGQVQGGHLEDYAGSVEAAARLAADWEQGPRDPAASLELARSLRPATPREAREVVVGALATLHPDSVWDALRLVGLDLFARRPELLPVHPVTATSALNTVARSARLESTRRVALLQAASWLCLYRGALRMDAGRGGFDPLVDERELPAPELEQVFAQPDPMTTRAFLEGPGDVPGFARSMRRHLFDRGAREHHQHKYAAAVLEEVGRADPRWHAALLAPCLSYLPTGRSEPTELALRTGELADELVS